MIVDTGTFIINSKTGSLECKWCKEVCLIPFTEEELKWFSDHSWSDINRQMERFLIVKEKILCEMRKHTECVSGMLAHEKLTRISMRDN